PGHQGCQEEGAIDRHRLSLEVEKAKTSLADASSIRVDGLVGARQTSPGPPRRFLAGGGLAAGPPSASDQLTSGELRRIPSHPPGPFPGTRSREPYRPCRGPAWRRASALLPSAVRGVSLGPPLPASFDIANLGRAGSATLRLPTLRP